MHGCACGRVASELSTSSNASRDPVAGRLLGRPGRPSINHTSCRFFIVLRHGDSPLFAEPKRGQSPRFEGDSPRGLWGTVPFLQSQKGDSPRGLRGTVPFLQSQKGDSPRSLNCPRFFNGTAPRKGLVMNSIVLLTALTATSGIFGGGARQQTCTTGQCGAVYAAPVAQQHYAAAPAPQYYTQAAPVAQPSVGRRQWFRPARVAYTTSCPGGTCNRR